METAEECTGFAKCSSEINGSLEVIEALDSAVEESHKLVKDVKGMCFSENNKYTNEISNDKDTLATKEEISRFLCSGPSRLLLPDMEHLYDLEFNVEINIAMTTNALERIKHYIHTMSSAPIKKDFDFNSNLKEYTANLEGLRSHFEELAKSLTYINSNMCGKQFRDFELESKLKCLCDEVGLFWKVIFS